jgi:pSer/pThr/pTyr-binding forkhead associated (FHA) protein
MPQLIMTTATGETTYVPLKPNENTLGRAPQNDIVIDSPQASRVHAVIIVEPAFVTIRDLGSRNGTFVNGDRIRTQLLAQDDIIRLGDCEIRFASADQEFSQVEAPRAPTQGLLVDLDSKDNDAPTALGAPPTARGPR